jgi:flagellar basal body-associated protein FliL
MTDEQITSSAPVVAAKTNRNNGSKNLSLGLAVALILVSVGSWFYVHGQTGTTGTFSSQTKALTVVHLEPFVTNLAGAASDSNYLRLTIDLSLEKGQREAEKQETGKVNSSEIPIALLRDTILVVLATRTGEDLLTADGKNKLKADLLKALQERAPEAGIHDIYFTDFLVQR